MEHFGRILRLWFGVKEPVGRLAYAASGFGLATFKYLVEALVIWLYAGAMFAPWDFLNPLLSLRTDLLRGAPAWLAWALFAWSLPLLWVAISMSVRRAADVGMSPWLGLLVLVPLINLWLMLTLCVLRGQPQNRWSPHGGSPFDQQGPMKGVLSIGLGLIIGGGMTVVSIYLLSTYGAALFLGTPLVMSSVAAYSYNRPFSRGTGASVGIGLATVACGGMALLLFALEGLICIAMALPLLVPLGALGGLMGKAIADSTRRAFPEALAAVVLLPLWAGAESWLSRSRELQVTTSVEIDASPADVWSHVVQFPDLPEPTDWLFRAGIACPMRARIEGEGVGATRYCEFTTGSFVEPITAWEPARRLAFDVTKQPAPMFELSPYRHVHPPHLDGYLRSTRGEFLLAPLPNGRTRLEGRTWYEFDMFPQAYWTLWSDTMIHRIHLRVLEHIKQRAEEAAQRAE
jgi:uncharacterized membrane protein YhaH (DUF805 family)